MGHSRKPTITSTRLARTAIAEFVDSNVPRFNRWLEKVANGIPKVDREGNVIYNADGSVEWVAKPSPAEALKICANLCEYHLPRLSRQEVTATVEHLPVDQRSTAQLQQQILERLGLFDGEIIDVEPLPVSSTLDKSGDVG